MAERFKMADLIAAALAGKPQEQAERPSTPTPQPEAPQRPASERRRPIGQTHTREVHAGLVVGSRQAQRDARAYAELWWQALRDWDTRSDGGDLVIGSGQRSPSAGRMQVVGVGNWGGAPTGTVWYTKLHTPMGWISESAVALAVSGPLERVRAGGGLATLIHASGRGWAGGPARTAGAAVLALAVSLGDQTALTHLPHLPNAED
ncbi:hypothetical protein HLB42_09700 [Deinococcus sp. D7000]|nr:hypothetical protein HLB42_09700 [Deinococcus sp. D7000]